MPVERESWRGRIRRLAGLTNGVVTAGLAKAVDQLGVIGDGSQDKPAIRSTEKQPMFRKLAKNGMPMMLPPQSLSGDCWACGRKTTFIPLVGQGMGHYQIRSSAMNGLIEIPDVGVTVADGNKRLGFRSCSSPECSAIVLAMIGEHGEAVDFYPAPGIHFDHDNIPAPIVEAMQEALVCYRAKAYRGSAALVRLAIELTCDANGATDGSLRSRIKQLQAKAILSPEVLEGMEHIAFLGNDAVHGKMLQFDEVNEDTVGTAIMVILEILRALYQTKHIVTALNRLRKPTATAKT